MDARLDKITSATTMANFSGLSITDATAALTAIAAKAPKLQKLSLKGNQITALPATIALPELTMLDLRGNPVADIASILRGLQSLPKLQVLAVDVGEDDEEELIMSLAAIEDLNDEDALDPAMNDDMATPAQSRPATGGDNAAAKRPGSTSVRERRASIAAKREASIRPNSSSARRASVLSRSGRRAAQVRPVRSGEECGALMDVVVKEAAAAAALHSTAVATEPYELNGLIQERWDTAKGLGAQERWDTEANVTMALKEDAAAIATEFVKCVRCSEADDVVGAEPRGPRTFAVPSRALVIHVWHSRREARTFHESLRCASNAKTQHLLGAPVAVPLVALAAHQGALVTVVWLPPILTDSAIVPRPGSLMEATSEILCAGVGVSDPPPMYPGRDGRLYLLRGFPLYGGTWPTLATFVVPARSSFVSVRHPAKIVDMEEVDKLIPKAVTSMIKMFATEQWPSAAVAVERGLITEEMHKHGLNAALLARVLMWLRSNDKVDHHNENDSYPARTALQSAISAEMVGRALKHMVLATAAEVDPKIGDGSAAAYQKERIDAMRDIFAQFLLSQFVASETFYDDDVLGAVRAKYRLPDDFVIKRRTIEPCVEAIASHVGARVGVSTMALMESDITSDEFVGTTGLAVTCITAPEASLCAPPELLKDKDGNDVPPVQNSAEKASAALIRMADTLADPNVAASSFKRRFQATVDLLGHLGPHGRVARLALGDIAPPPIALKYITSQLEQFPRAGVLDLSPSETPGVTPIVSPKNATRPALYDTDTERENSDPASGVLLAHRWFALATTLFAIIDPEKEMDNDVRVALSDALERGVAAFKAPQEAWADIGFTTPTAAEWRTWLMAVAKNVPTMCSPGCRSAEAMTIARFVVGTAACRDFSHWQQDVGAMYGECFRMMVDPAQQLTTLRIKGSALSSHEFKVFSMVTADTAATLGLEACGLGLSECAHVTIGMIAAGQQRWETYSELSEADHDLALECARCVAFELPSMSGVRDFIPFAFLLREIAACGAFAFTLRVDRLLGAHMSTLGDQKEVEDALQVLSAGHQVVAKAAAQWKLFWRPPLDLVERRELRGRNLIFAGEQMCALAALKKAETSHRDAVEAEQMRVMWYQPAYDEEETARDLIFAEEVAARIKIIEKGEGSMRSLWEWFETVFLLNGSLEMYNKTLQAVALRRAEGEKEAEMPPPLPTHAIEMLEFSARGVLHTALLKRNTDTLFAMHKDWLKAAGGENNFWWRQRFEQTTLEVREQILQEEAAALRKLRALQTDPNAQRFVEIDDDEDVARAEITNDESAEFTTAVGAFTNEGLAVLQTEEKRVRSDVKSEYKAGGRALAEQEEQERGRAEKAHAMAVTFGKMLGSDSNAASGDVTSGDYSARGAGGGEGRRRRSKQEMSKKSVRAIRRNYQSELDLMKRKPATSRTADDDAAIAEKERQIDELNDASEAARHTLADELAGTILMEITQFGSVRDREIREELGLLTVEQREDKADERAGLRRHLSSYAVAKDRDDQRIEELNRNLKASEEEDRAMRLRVAQKIIDMKRSASNAGSPKSGPGSARGDGQYVDSAEEGEVILLQDELAALQEEARQEHELKRREKTLELELLKEEREKGEATPQMMARIGELERDLAYDSRMTTPATGTRDEEQQRRRDQRRAESDTIAEALEGYDASKLPSPKANDGGAQGNDTAADSKRSNKDMAVTFGKILGSDGNLTSGEPSSRGGYLADEGRRRRSKQDLESRNSVRSIRRNYNAELAIMKRKPATSRTAEDEAAIVEKERQIQELNDASDAARHTLADELAGTILTEITQFGSVRDRDIRAELALLSAEEREDKADERAGIRGELSALVVQDDRNDERIEELNRNLKASEEEDRAMRLRVASQIIDMKRQQSSLQPTPRDPAVKSPKSGRVSGRGSERGSLGSPQQSEIIVLQDELAALQEEARQERELKRREKTLELHLLKEERDKGNATAAMQARIGELEHDLAYDSAAPTRESTPAAGTRRERDEEQQQRREKRREETAAVGEAMEGYDPAMVPIAVERTSRANSIRSSRQESALVTGRKSHGSAAPEEDRTAQDNAANAPGDGTEQETATQNEEASAENQPAKGETVKVVVPDGDDGIPGISALELLYRSFPDRREAQGIRVMIASYRFKPAPELSKRDAEIIAEKEGQGRYEVEQQFLESLPFVEFEKGYGASLAVLEREANGDRAAIECDVGEPLMRRVAAIAEDNGWRRIERREREAIHRAAALEHSRVTAEALRGMERPKEVLPSTTPAAVEAVEALGRVTTQDAEGKAWTRLIGQQRESLHRTHALIAQRFEDGEGGAPAESMPANVLLRMPPDTTLRARKRAVAAAKTVAPLLLEEARARRAMERNQLIGFQRAARGELPLRGTSPVYQRPASTPALSPQRSNAAMDVADEPKVAQKPDLYREMVLAACRASSTADPTPAFGSAVEPRADSPPRSNAAHSTIDVSAVMNNTSAVTATAATPTKQLFGGMVKAGPRGNAAAAAGPVYMCGEDVFEAEAATRSDMRTTAMRDWARLVSREREAMHAVQASLARFDDAVREQRSALGDFAPDADPRAVQKLELHEPQKRMIILKDEMDLWARIVAAEREDLHRASVAQENWRRQIQRELMERRRGGNDDGRALSDDEDDLDDGRRGFRNAYGAVQGRWRVQSRETFLRTI